MMGLIKKKYGACMTNMNRRKKPHLSATNEQMNNNIINYYFRTY